MNKMPVMMKVAIAGLVALTPGFAINAMLNSADSQPAHEYGYKTGDVVCIESIAAKGVVKSVDRPAHIIYVLFPSGRLTPFVGTSLALIGPCQ